MWPLARLEPCSSKSRNWSVEGIDFDRHFAPRAIVLTDSDWRQDGPLHVVGSAELLDRQGSRTIRVRGKTDGRATSRCGRCLEPVSEEIHENFDLFYYPMAMIAPIRRDSDRPGRTRIWVSTRVADWNCVTSCGNSSCCGFPCAPSAMRTARVFARIAAPSTARPSAAGERILSIPAGTPCGNFDRS